MVLVHHYEETAWMRLGIVDNPSSNNQLPDFQIRVVTQQTPPS